MSSLIYPVEWRGSSEKDFKKFPIEVKRRMGYALKLAQSGGKHDAAKPLQGYGNARVLEVRVNFKGDTYRLVYLVDPPSRIIVVHSYKKKSTLGISTPKPDAAMIDQRLKDYFKDRYL